jgi:hypothetical protein
MRVAVSDAVPVIPLRQGWCSSKKVLLLLFCQSFFCCSLAQPIPLQSIFNSSASLPSGRAAVMHI